MKKRLFSVLLAVVMLVCLVAVLGINLSAAYPTGTIDGTEITWKFDTDRKILTISGTGDIPDYNLETFNQAPWYAYKDQITTVVVRDTVSSVGTYSFLGYNAITRIELGNSAKNIKDSAFSGCSTIDTLVLSNDVTIASNAFDNYNSIANIIKWAFDTSTGILTISGNGDMPDYGLYTYQNAPWYAYKDQITAVVVGDAVSSVAEYSFYGYKYITKAEIGSSVKQIDGYAFYSCSAIETLTLSEGLETIGTSAFQSCKGIKKLTIPASCTSLIGTPFYWCAIEEITFAEGTTIIDCGNSSGGSNRPFGESLKKVNFPSTVERIEDYAFYGYRNLHEVTIPKSVKYIGKSAFAPYDNSVGVTSLIFEDGGTEPLEIAQGAFSDHSLESLELPERLTTIKSEAFSGRYDNKITIINIPKNVSSISPTAFNSANSGFTSNLQNIYVDEDNPYYKSSDDGVLYSKDGKTLVMCPRGKKGSITVPEGVEIIGSNAFANCKVSSINLPDSLTEIEDRAFAYCTNISTITIPQNVKSIGEYAFSGDYYNKQSITSIILPEGIDLEGKTGFGTDYNKKLTSVTITNNSSSIEITGEDVHRVVGNTNSAVSMNDLLNDGNIVNPIVVTETKNGDITVYEIAPNQMQVDQNGDLTVANGYHRVIFDDGSDDLTGLVVATGSKIDKSADPTKNGFIFGGWYKESTCVNEWNFDTDTVTADTTIYAKWTFSVSNIDVEGSLVKPYDGEQIKLTAENKADATYQWYKNTEAIPGATNINLTLEGKIADNGTYYCFITLDGVTAKTNEVTVNVSKAKVEFLVEEMSLPLSMIDGVALQLIHTLQLTPVPYDYVSGYGVTVKYNKKAGGADDELESFIQAGALTVQLGTEEVNGDVTTYPIILSCVDNNAEYIALQTHYDVTFSSNAKFMIKPEATIAWDDDILQNGISIDYIGSALMPSTDLFTVTDGKTPATELTGGEKGYTFYYMIMVEDITSGQRNWQYESQLQQALNWELAVGEYAEFDSDIIDPSSYMSEYVKYLSNCAFDNAKIVFNYYVKATYSGNDTYFGTESEFVLLTVKPIPLTVKAKDQTIFTNGAIVADVNTIVLEGAILANDEIRDMLEIALPDLVDFGIITIEADISTSTAGEYTEGIVVKYHNELLTGEDAIAASMFDITTVNGTLTVVDVSDVNGTIKALQDKIQELENAIGNLGTNNDIASQINDLADKITAAQNSIDTLDDKSATNEELNNAKDALEGKITEAKTALQGQIDKLTERVTKLEKDLKEANDKIDLKAEKTDVTAVKDSIVELEKKLTTAGKLISELKNLHIEDIEALKSSLQTAVNDANAKIAEANAKIAELEGRVDSLEEAKTKLEADVAALQSAVATKVSTEALTAAINTLKTAIDGAKAYADGLSNELKAADAAINAAIEELKIRVTALETGLKYANGKIDTNTSNVDDLKKAVTSLKQRMDEAEKAISDLKTLTSTMQTELQAKISDLNKTLTEANGRITDAEKRIAALEGRVEDLKKDQEALEKAVSELKASMTSTTEALAKEIKDTGAALEAAKKAASDGDAELKKAIETAESALNGAIDELKNRVTVIESVLTTANANINTNTTDIATLKANIKTIEMLQAEAEKTIKALGTLIGTNESNIAELQTSVTKLQESVYAADTKIAAAEARIAVLEGKVEELEGVKNELQASVANLQAALATKADRETVNNAVAALQASISALQAAQNNYVYADMMLKSEIEYTIEAAKVYAVSTAKDLVSQSASELQAAIDKKADSATLELKVGELAAAITLAESTSKAYADAQNAILKDAVEAELRAANELIASLGIRMTDAEEAIEALEAALKTLEKVTADDAKALEDAVAALNQALSDAKALADDADAALNEKIIEAQKSLEAKISDVQSKLNKAIKELKAADASNADELKKAIKSIEEAMAAAESARGAADSALESKLTEAQSELTRKIAEVQANLDTAKNELNKALESGDTALGDKIKALNDALEAAKAASDASDVALKTELTTKIDESDAAIYALIEKLQKELQESNAELNTAIEEGDGELNTQFIISTSVAGVGVAGNIALLAWILISKKKKLF